MKNPMTTDEMKQAIKDNAAGYPMQFGSLHKLVFEWKDRTQGAGEPLNFFDYEYRRKPRTSEDILKMAVEWWLGDGKQKFIGAPAWVFAAREIIELEPEEKNPWRPIIKGEWPECKSSDEIICRDKDGHTWTNRAGNQGWNDPLAIEWKYAEDE